MKKILFALSALAVVFAAGCSKEDIDIPSPEYQLVVNMDKPSFGDDTRAPRSSWEDGDVVYVVFNGDVEECRYLKLSFNGSSWTPEWVNTTADAVAAKETKTLMAGYTKSALSSTPNYLQIIGGINFVSSNTGECVMICKDGTYTVSDNTITLNLVMKPDVSQVTISNINVEDGWTLKCDKLTQCGGFFVSNFSVGASTGSTNGPLIGYANTDGVAFYGQTQNGSVQDYTFTLSNDSKTYTRKFTSKSLNKGDAVLMDGPTTDVLNGWEEKIPVP